MSVRLVVSIPTLVGSLSSFMASGFVLALYVCLPREKHFRHALIVNLLIADFLNSLNNSVSGIAILVRSGRMLSPGPACNFNGWLAQITVQTVDFTIIAISIVVLLTIKKKHITSHPPMWKAILICLLTWVPGTITSSIALALSYYGPVSGNWCWIKPSLLLQRYLFTHGWHIAIFLSTIAIYTVIYVSLKRTYGKWFSNPSTESKLGAPSQEESPGLKTQLDGEQQNAKNIAVTRSVNIRIDDGCLDGPERAGEATSSANTLPLLSAEARALTLTDENQTSSSESIIGLRRKELRRILLLNGYPIMYVVLWIPGILNRVVESSGGRTSLWLAVLQSSTQFIGLANALTYGWNEGLRQQITTEWQKKKSRLYIKRDDYNSV